MFHRLVARQFTSSTSHNSRRAKQTQRRGLRFERLETRAMLSARADFNGDGFDDLAISVLQESVGLIGFAGAVNVIYGSRTGLTTSGNQFWHLDAPGVNGVAAFADGFGSALAAGDFNGDGFADLAIGIPFKTINGQAAAGAVSVLYGSKNGLRAGAVDQFWTQDSPGVNDMAEAGDHFGRALTAGDFNGDGRDDLAIGAPGESVGSVSAAGAVNVLYGSNNGLRAGSVDQLWTQDSPGINDMAEQDDRFGTTLASGDFNGDGRDDLAIGVPDEYVGTIVRAGAVNVIYGSAGGLTSSGDQFWHQDSAGVAGDPETDDGFGKALAAGDFNRDGRDDLAIGVWRDNVDLVSGAGGVNLLYGSSNKLQSVGGVAQLTASSLGFTSSLGVRFGTALATGDFNRDGRADLAIGALFDANSGVNGAGAVYVAFGSSSLGLSASSAQRWEQNDVGGIPSFNDSFGAALAAGDYDGDGRADLAISAQNKSVSGVTGAGTVFVNYSNGWISPSRRRWDQNKLSASDGVQMNEFFGFKLA